MEPAAKLSHELLSVLAGGAIDLNKPMRSISEEGIAVPSLPERRHHAGSKRFDERYLGPQPTI
jgi:hypothetical protein